MRWYIDYLKQNRSCKLYNCVFCKHFSYWSLCQQCKYNFKLQITHWVGLRGVVSTVTQRHLRWFNVTIMSCAHWAVTKMLDGTQHWNIIQLFMSLIFPSIPLAQVVHLDMKGCICHFVKWQIHPFISKGTISTDVLTNTHIIQTYSRTHEWP